MTKCTKTVGSIFLWHIITITLIYAVLGMQPAKSSELNYKLHLGLWSEHYYNDSSDLNEKNDLVQISIHNKNRFFVAAATFNNSHYARSHVLGIGREFQSKYFSELQWGIYLAAIHGYEGYQETHAEGLIFAPVSYYKYKYFKFTIFGPAVNAGIEVPITW